MSKKLVILDVMQMTGVQLQMLLNPSNVMALYSTMANGQPYMVCLVDTQFRFRLPEVSDPVIYAALLGATVKPGYVLTYEEYIAVVDGLDGAQEGDAVGELLQKVIGSQGL